MRFSKSAVTVAVAASIPLAVAQTSTSCNPLDKSCPADTGLDSSSYTADFTQGSSANASWSAAAYTTLTYGSQGAEFSIGKSGQAPTIQTDFYIFFGRVDVTMKAAPGTGIVSSIVFESDDLDEIDWEFLGGNTAQVETNFFGKGNTTAYDRAVYYPVSTPQDTFHTYTVDWNSDRIEWIIDGTVVRTLAYDDPLTVGGQNYPQTPMRVKLGNWCGGCAGEPEGTIEWAGGNTTFTANPYVMYVESVKITNYNPGSSYEYSDKSGSWQSIKVVNNGQSSNPSGGGSASNGSSTASVTASASGSVSGSTGGSTSAPTSMISVAGVQGQTVAAVSSTITGSSYSMNTASASAQNANGTGVVTATTEVPGSSPSSSSGSGSSSNGTSGSAASSSSNPSTQGTSGATSISALSAGSLLSIVLGLLFI